MHYKIPRIVFIALFLILAGIISVVVLSLIEEDEKSVTIMDDSFQIKPNDSYQLYLEEGSYGMEFTSEATIEIEWIGDSPIAGRNKDYRDGSYSTPFFAEEPTIVKINNISDSGNAVFVHLKVVKYHRPSY